MINTSRQMKVQHQLQKYHCLSVMTFNGQASLICGQKSISRPRQVWDGCIFL